MVDRSDWNAPWFNKTFWIFDHLEDLKLDPQEILVVLVLNYLNETRSPIVPDIVSAKTGLDLDAVDTAFESLAARGYLTIDTRNKKLHFLLDGLLDGAPVGAGKPIESGLISEFSTEFGRPLSPNEMERILQMEETHSEAVILRALDEASAYEKRSVGYVEALLAGWKARGLSDEDIESGKR